MDVILPTVQILHFAQQKLLACSISSHYICSREEEEEEAKDLGMASTATTLLTSALFPIKGRTSFAAPGLQWGNERYHQRKAGPSTITAKFELKHPPYPLDALEPLMSKDTLDYHWGKHHKAYVDNLNNQVVGTELDEMSLEDVVVTTYNKGDFLPAFNNAAQAWNHEFFWGCMKPGGGGKPSGELLQLIERDFGTFEKFVEEFKSAAASQFGSGWAWLVYKVNRLDVENAVNPRSTEEDKKLTIVKSPNAVNPLVWNHYPLLTIDVWEHAYYLDFENRRPDYISTFFKKLVSWEAVAARLEVAKADATEKEQEEERRRNEAEQTPGSEPVEVYVDSEETDDSEAE